MQPTVPSPATPRLERIARPVGGTRLVAGRRSTLYAEAVAAAVGPHAAPAWKVVVALGGRVEVAWHSGRAEAAGVVVPPGVVHEARSTAGHLALLVDPWHEGLGRGSDVVALADTLAEPLRRDLLPASRSGLDDVVSDVVARLRRHGALAPAASLDDRLVAVLDALALDEPVADAAAAVQLSPGRLRAVASSQLGTPLVRFRSWARLRRAVLHLDRLAPADAAASAGFADQAHLTRTAARLLGRTPGSVAPGLRA